MNRLRLGILVFGPIPIVAGSIVLTNWVRSGAPSILPSNRVWAADEIPGPNTAQPPTSAEATAARIREGLESFLDTECKKTAERLQKQLGDECAVMVHKPFVVAGDMTAKQLEDHYRTTISPAARAMANSYFRKPPTLPITVLLFSAEASYNRYAKQLFNEEGVSVYGYYKPDKRTLVMNIATGGGTLIHEMTHALVVYDFPEIPDWFNEGLASLHEQCRFLPDEKGVEGLPNWRLPGLQEAIRQGRLSTLQEMMTRDDFRGPHVGLNYAQARYFCLYLQKLGRLEAFYRRFRGAHEGDPHGVDTARDLLGEEDWATLDHDFMDWALKLSY
jgi:hypothetical protein